MEKPLKYALVTGAGAGLGQAFVGALTKDGWHVTCVDRDQRALVQMVPDNNETRMSTHVCDLTDLDAVAALVAKLQGKTLDLAIFNAGISATGKFEQIPVEAHRRLMALNAVSPMMMSQALVRAKVIGAGSRLLFISSLSHAVGYPGAASYAASKDTIAIYAKSIAKPYAKLGIGVSCAFPGPLRTDHAARHSPTEAKAEKRMPPGEAARLILRDTLRGKRRIYPGLPAKSGALLGALAPRAATNLMRKTVFEKLDKDVW